VFGLNLLRPTARRTRTAVAMAGIALAGVAATTSCSPPPRPANNVALNKQIAWNQLVARGWASQAQCLVNLWTHESSWNVYATNPSSGAYGIPQALPGIKLASAGSDWVTNPATQIRWGLDYIAGRYGNPCNAWAHEIQVNWYSISVPVGR
jgi:hypothetical protein